MHLIAVVVLKHPGTTLQNLGKNKSVQEGFRSSNSYYKIYSTETDIILAQQNVYLDRKDVRMLVEVIVYIFKDNSLGIQSPPT